MNHLNKLFIAALLISSVCAADAFGQTRRKTAAATRRKKPTVARKNMNTTPKTTTPETAAPQAGTTTASGLTYIVTDPKPGGQQLKAGDNVIVHYTGLLTNGTKFDSSLDRGQPFSFQLGAGKVIKGWDEGLQKLRIGERATLIIPPTIGYGARGAGGVIPPNATLIFIVEVVGVQ